MLSPAADSLDHAYRDIPSPRGQDPDLFENRLRGTFLVAKDATDAWSVHQTLGSFHLSQSPAISQTGVSVPKDLWTVDTGAAFRRRLGDRNEWGFSGSFGSASDKPYHSIHGDTFRATGSYRFPSGERNAWLLSLSYSNNRHFANGAPLPGVAYILHSPETGLDAVLGLPFLSVHYRPAPDWTGRLTLFGPDNVSAEWAYRFWNPLQAYAGFDWSQREWLRAGRPDNSQRLFYDEKKWALGLRFPVIGPIRMDMGAAYNFDRRMYESRRARSSGVADVEFHPSWSLQTRLAARW